MDTVALKNAGRTPAETQLMEPRLTDPLASTPRMPVEEKRGRYRDKNRKRHFKQCERVTH